MAKRNKENTAVCARCDCELTDENCRPNGVNHSGYSAYCVSCEQSIFDSIAETQGRFMGLFFTCIALDVPCSPCILEDCQDEFNNGDSAWLTYINALSEHKADTRRGKPIGFNDGAVTSLQRLFGKDLSHNDFVAYIDNERKKIDQLPGTKEQRERWGIGKEYQTPADYDELDRLFEARLASYQGQDLTPQAICILENVVKWTFKIDKLIEKGNFNGAKALNDMIDKNLASENLRLKDGKQTENMRMDMLVDSLERKGLMEQGKFKTKDEVIEAISEHFTHTKKYDYPIDALHQMELNMLNTMRGNADFNALFDLSKDMEVEDINHEFAEEESEEYKKRKSYANLTEIRFIGGDETREETQQSMPKPNANKKGEP